MTHALYLNDTYLYESHGKIVDQSQDSKGKYLILDQTNFYPQGGGQPSDQGLIVLDGQQIRIVQVKQFDSEIRHYYEGDIDRILIGLNVITRIDSVRRLLNACYHTSAHLIGNVIEKLYWNLKAVKGHSFPNEAYVEFNGQSNIDLSIVNEAIKFDLNSNINNQVFEILPSFFEEQYYKLSYVVPDNKVFRAMQIGNYNPIPCGGTHLTSLKEIRHINISKISFKNESTKVMYNLNWNLDTTDQLDSPALKLYN